METAVKFRIVSRCIVSYGLCIVSYRIEILICIVSGNSVPHAPLRIDTVLPNYANFLFSKTYILFSMMTFTAKN